MDDFRLTPDFRMDGSVSGMIVSSEKHKLEMFLSANIVADDEADVFEWNSFSGYEVYGESGISLRLRDDEVEIEFDAGGYAFYSCKFVLPVDPDDFRQLFRDAAAIVADPAKYFDQ